MSDPQRPPTAAEPLLARAGRRLVATGAPVRAPRWAPPAGVTFTEYRLEPDTSVRIFVYAFASESAASSAEPAVRQSMLDGTRAQVVRHGAIVVWVEAPMGLPGRPAMADTQRDFDAIVSAVSRP